MPIAMKLVSILSIVTYVCFLTFNNCSCFIVIPTIRSVARSNNDIHGNVQTSIVTQKWISTTNHDDNTETDFMYPSNDETNAPDQFIINRRTVFQKSISDISVVTALLSSLSMFSNPAFAVELKDIIKPDKPIVVLGGGGKVGKLCTELLANKGIYVKCVTRSGRQILADDSPFVSYASANVNDYDSLENVCTGAYGVIFAASASGKKKGGDPAHVDYKGLYNTAKACLKEKVPKLIVVSAGTVTRPDSIGFKATNGFVKYIYGDRIMDYKIAGENLVRELYSTQNDSGLTYTIVRPGGLSDKGPVGSAEVHISQGDVYSSEVTRADVAAVCVACLECDYADNTTFELNQVEGLGKAMKTLPDLPSELIHTKQSSYIALLNGLKTDAIMKEQYPGTISTFGGNGIEPVDQIV